MKAELQQPAGWAWGPSLRGLCCRPNNKPELYCFPLTGLPAEHSGKEISVTYPSFWADANGQVLGHA